AAEKTPGPASKAPSPSGRDPAQSRRNEPDREPRPGGAKAKTSAHPLDRPASTDSAWQIAAGGGDLPRLRRAGGPAPGPGIVARFQRGTDFRPGLSLSAYRVFPSQANGREVTVEVSGYRFRAGLSAGPKLHDPFSLDGLVGAGADVMSYRASSVS